MRISTAIGAFASTSLFICGQSIADTKARSPWQFEYPQRADMVASTSKAFSVSYVLLREDPRRGNEYRLSIRDQKGKEVVKYDFGRWVSGNWSPYSDALFVNDFEGSNFADCLIWTSGGNSKGWTRLSKILIERRNSGPVDVPGMKPPETPENSHYYLTCQKWLEPSLVKVTLQGHTDVGGEFKYVFEYDLIKQHFSNTDRD